MTSHKLLSLAIGVALSLAGATSTVHAHDADIAALEARVAELEAKLDRLLSEQVATKPEPIAEVDAPAPAPAHDYSFGGYLKLDAMFSDYSGGDMAPGSAGTQFYIPATIPVGGTPGEGPDADLQGRESRIHFRSDHRLESGDQFSTYLEMDFFLSPGGDERVSNSYNPRLRHAFVKYNNWLFGQTWSTFQDIEALPENLDFIGPSESTVFIRQPQVRYKNGSWEFAIENPETTITPFGGGARIISDDGSMPDVVGRYTAALDNGYIRAAALVRQLSYEAEGIDADEMAYGFSLSGKHMFGDDDIRWMATWGSGTGRYLGLNTANGAVLDSNNELERIDQWGAFVSLRHFWNTRWRSNLTFGYLSNDHDVGLTGTGETRDVYSIHANLLFEPVPDMIVGGELLYAERELENELSGDMTRFLLSARHSF